MSAVGDVRGDFYFISTSFDLSNPLNCTSVKMTFMLAEPILF